MIRFRGVVLGVVLLGVVGCVPKGLTAGDTETAQALVEVSTAMTDLREVDAALQAEIDSLRQVVARQDSVLRQIANLAGVPLPPR